jgi:hypothetical protein
MTPWDHIIVCGNCKPEVVSYFIQVADIMRKCNEPLPDTESILQKWAASRRTNQKVKSDLLSER